MNVAEKDHNRCKMVDNIRIDHRIDGGGHRICASDRDGNADGDDVRIIAGIIIR